MYRDIQYLKKGHKTYGFISTDVFLSEVFPALLLVMEVTRKFDTDGDGMIENSGYFAITMLSNSFSCGGIAICNLMYGLSISTPLELPIQ